MLETIGNLIRYLVILIFISALLEMILPQGVFRRYLRMLIGILLIFTLITPLQKIMHIAPYWEMPPLTEGRANENAGELEEILGRGEQLYREKMKSALEDYRAQVFVLLENELAREFKQKLLHLRVIAEDDPDSREFGMLKNIYAVVQAQEPVPKVEPLGDPEEIHVSVKVSPPGGRVPAKGQPENGEEPEKLAENFIPAGSEGDKAAEIEKYLAAYFRLSPEDVKVEILP